MNDPDLQRGVRRAALRALAVEQACPGAAVLGGALLQRLWAALDPDQRATLAKASLQRLRDLGRTPSV